MAIVDIANSALATDLVSYWKLEEGSGTRVDSHGSNDLTGSTRGAVTAIRGDGNDFESGSSDYLSISDASQTGLDLTGDNTISFWYKPESNTSGVSYTIVSKWSDNQRSYFVQYRNDSGTHKIRGSYSDDGVGTGTGLMTVNTSSITTGNWYHYAITFDVSANQMEVFLDGVSQGTTTGSSIASIANDTGTFAIGCNEPDDAATQFTDGVLDGVAIHSRILLDSEILALYNGGKGIPYEATTVFKSATVNASDVPATQSNFPAYVDLSRIGITTLREANSVRVYSDEAKTTELAREIVSASEMHVKIPNLTSATTIYVEYDDVKLDYDATDTYGRNAVWSDYEAVYHMNEASGSLTDSTGNGYTQSAVGTPTYEETGQIGNGITLTKDTSDGFDGADFLSGATSFTWQGWFNWDGGTTNENALYSYGSGFDTWMDINPPANTLRFALRNTGGVRVIISTSSYTPTIGADVMFHGVYSGSAMNIYINGSGDGSGSHSGTVSDDGDTLIGNRNTTDAVAGTLDEFRVVKNDSLSANWITTEYNNQSDEATFWGTWTDVGGGGGGGATNNAMAFGGGV